MKPEVPLNSIPTYLFYASVATTGNIYAHAIRSADETAADKLEEILGEKKDECSDKEK